MHLQPIQVKMESADEDETQETSVKCQMKVRLNGRESARRRW